MGDIMPTPSVEDAPAINSRINQIKNKIIVLSGKGGVGKSTVAANIARSLAAKGHAVGLLDVDIHGPSIPTLFNLTGTSVQLTGNAMDPIDAGGIKLMSTGFMIANSDQAIIARGPMKNKIIEQMLQDVNWGELDYLIVDCPPGTGDEPLSVCQLIGKPNGAVIVTTPQEIAAADVRKSIQFCRKIDLPILGLVENMSVYNCPSCGEKVYLFGRDGGRRISEKYNIAFLGDIPIDPAIGVCGDAGSCFLKTHSPSPTATALETIVTQMNVALTGTF